MKKKLAIFDLDGTLFDTADVNYASYYEACKEEGYEIDYDYFCKYCNGRKYTDFLPSITTSNKVVLEQMHRRKKELYPKYLSKSRVNIHLFHMLNLLRNDYYVALVTTASKRNTNDILKYHELSKCFDLVIAQEDVAHMKPNPEGFLLAAKHFNMRPDDTIIFEDSDVGIEAALKCGATVMRVIKF